MTRSWKYANAWLDAHPEVRSRIGKVIHDAAHRADPNYSRSRSRAGKIGGPVAIDKVRHLAGPRSRRRERRVVDFLRSRGLYALRQKRIGRYVIDVFVPSKELVIEVDGFKHGWKEIRARDLRRDAVLKKLGLRTVRITNYEVDAGDFDVLKKALG